MEWSKELLKTKQNKTKNPQSRTHGLRQNSFTKTEKEEEIKIIMITIIYIYIYIYKTSDAQAIAHHLPTSAQQVPK